jgi:hypothetical protein
VSNSIVAKLLSNIMAPIHFNLIEEYRILDGTIWNNAQKLTPQEVCDSLGTAAATAFDLLDTIKSLCAAVFPLTVLQSQKPASAAVTKNADGTVTIGAAAATAAPSATPAATVETATAATPITTEASETPSAA